MGAAINNFEIPRLKRDNYLLLVGLGSRIHSRKCIVCVSLKYTSRYLPKSSTCENTKYEKVFAPQYLIHYFANILL